VIPGDSSIIQLFDPLGWAEDPIAEGNVEVGDLSVVLLVAVGGLFKDVLIVLDTVMEPTDLLFEAADFTGLLGVVSGDGCEEPLSDGLENVRVEFWVLKRTALADLSSSTDRVDPEHLKCSR
jgi:hypothetical protein